MKSSLRRKIIFDPRKNSESIKLNKHENPRPLWKQLETSRKIRWITGGYIELKTVLYFKVAKLETRYSSVTIQQKYNLRHFL